jgi:hypothetical protein
MWDSLAVEQYDEGISEDNRRVDIDGLEEARCAALVQLARYLEGIRRYHDHNVKERSCDNPPRKIPYYHLRPIHFGH